MKHGQHRLRGMQPDEQAAIVEFANDSIGGERLNFLNLRRFDAESKRLDAENRDFLNIQGIHRKKQAQRQSSRHCAHTFNGYFGSVPSTPSIK